MSFALMSQLQASLTSVGYKPLVPTCPICGEQNNGECPQANTSTLPSVAVIAAHSEQIADGVAYDGFRKPPMVEADDAGWRYL